MKKILLLTLAFIGFTMALVLYVPVEDPVYDFLERQAVRGYIPEFMNDTKPLQRDEIASWLQKMYDIKPDLHRVDRELLLQYISEYRPELTNMKHIDLSDSSESRLGFSSWSNFKNDMKSLFKDNVGMEEKHIYVMEDEHNTVWVDADFKVRGEGRDQTLRFMDQLGAYASIQVGKHLSLFVDGYFFHQYVPDGWPEPVKEFKGNWFNLDGDIEKIATWDRSEAYANFTGKFGTLTIAHSPLNWGNSLNSVILSDNAIPFGSIRWSKKFKHFRYNFLHGSLMTPSYTNMDDNGRYYIPKYLAAHRIEIMFSPKIHMNFSEMITYGGEDRIPEITYLVPTIFLWPSEHALGDRDNKMISLEAEVFPLKGLRLYGTAFLDELVFSQLFNDYWANKYAIQAGFQWSPRSIPADLIVEASAVHPWTYTHKYSFSSYTHHGRDLGFYLGPNTQSFTAKINYDISRKSKLILTFNQLWEGADSLIVNDIIYPSGGESNQNYEDMSFDLIDATTWLMGDISRTLSLRIDWLYRWKNQVSFLSSCELRRIDGVPDVYYSIQMNLNY